MGWMTFVSVHFQASQNGNYALGQGVPKTEVITATCGADNVKLSQGERRQVGKLGEELDPVDWKG